MSNVKVQIRFKAFIDLAFNLTFACLPQAGILSFELYLHCALTTLSIPEKSLMISGMLKHPPFSIKSETFDP
jgi:hypothetical protein